MHPFASGAPLAPDLSQKLAQDKPIQLQLLDVQPAGDLFQFFLPLMGDFGLHLDLQLVAQVKAELLDLFSGR